MSYKIKLGTFTKYVESTKQPNTATWTEYDVVFKDGTNIVNPTITLAIDYSTVSAYNYAYMLNRYYWITGRNMLRSGYCVLSLKTDPMATYKTDIGNADLYILRSSTQYDGTIVDHYYPPLASYSITTEVQDPDTVPLPSFNSGFYLVSIMGIKGGNTAGSEIVYRFSPSQFRALITQIYTGIDGQSLGDVVSWVSQKLGGNPQELISGVVWVPYDFPHAALEAVKVGGYATTASGGVVTQNTIDLADFTYTVPKHPKASSKGVYLNCEPFSDYTVYINTGGIVKLDSTKLLNDTTLTVQRTLDIKGQLLTTIRGTQSRYQYAKIFGQMGVQISLNGQNAGSSVISGIGATIAGAAAAIATGGQSAVLSAVASGVGTIAGAMGGASSNTSSGSIAGIGEAGSLQSCFYDIPPEDNARNGRPLCQVKKPSALGGFMIAQRGDVDISGTLPEEEEIKRYLESGFYYE